MSMLERILVSSVTSVTLKLHIPAERKAPHTCSTSTIGIFWFVVGRNPPLPWPQWSSTVPVSVWLPEPTRDRDEHRKT